MTDEVLSAVIGGAVGFAAAYLTVQFEIRKIKLQLQAAHRGELVRRQLNACEKIWAIFGAASRSGGEGRMIKNQDGQRFVQAEEARHFVRRLEDAFNSENGIYLSRRCRERLFEFRDFIRDAFCQEDRSHLLLPLSEQQFATFYELRRRARLALRAEVGTEDLQVASEELSRYES